MGKRLQSKGKVDLAIINFEKAISLKAGFDEAIAGLGKAFMSKSRHREGIDMLRSANGYISLDLETGLAFL